MSDSANPPPPSSSDTYNLSGDFRGAVVNIKSTLISSEAVREIESLPPEPGEPPYQGLQAFEEADAERFFGREMLVARLVARLKESSFLAVIGASGSGKSSVVRAGVIPALRGGKRLADGSLPPADSSQWEILLITPGVHPLATLFSALGDNIQQDKKISLSIAVANLLEKHNKSHLLLVIDQFEEIFTQCRTDEERTGFLDNLFEAIAATDPQPITILITLRADFYAQLAQNDHLRELVSQNQEFIGAMSRDELTRAILQPAALDNWQVQEGLVEVILDDLGATQDHPPEPGALPLLSHALLETWRRRRGRVLTLSGYTAAGGVRGAIAQTAESVFRQRLNSQQRPVARAIFVKLAELGESDGGGLTSPDTRRRAAFSELITRASDPATIQAVLNILIDARLVTTTTIEPEGQRAVEVSHEALIREWPTLRHWLDENREELIRHRQLTEDSSEWRKLERDPGALYRGLRLQQAQALAQAHPDWISLDEQEFLDASQKIAQQETAQVRRLQRARGIQIGLGAAAIILVVGLVVVILAANGFFAPREMSGIFNVAVGDIPAVSTAGEPGQRSTAGQEISAWVVRYVRQTLQDDPNLQIWPNQGGLFSRTQVGLVTVENAAQKAEGIHANLIFYGTLDTSQNPAQLQLSYYIAPQLDQHFDDIQGYHQAGPSIRIANLDDPGTSVYGELEKQVTTAAWIALGLTQVQLGQSEQALAAFQKAGEIDPNSADAQFFIGRENLFLADRHRDQSETYLQAAEDAFRRAIANDATHAFAYIGLGNIYKTRAAELLDSALQTGQPVDSRASDWTDEAIQNYLHVLDLNPDPARYGIPVADVARVSLGNAYRQQGVIAALQGDTATAQAAFEQALATLEGVRPVFENAVTENESLRRFLAQTYEHLGETYQWQGYAYELASDTDAALQAYQNAIAAYQHCSDQASGSSDLILQNEIVGLYCQPYAAESQARYETLKGGP